MLALDATTRSEYDAETTAADAAQAVVDALADPVTVRIYDGAGNVKASGTLGTPWATQAAGVITIGEVSSFAITAAGAPDPSWYLRFESGSRWLHGSFGLRGESADFVLSSDAWINGYTIRLGTVVVNAPSNAAPSLEGAPSSLAVVQGTGGTLDLAPFGSDPDGDTLTFSLVGTAYTGISISTAGLLTVTTSAAAAVRELVVRVTDTSGLSADWPLTVTVTASGVVMGTDWEEFASGFRFSSSTEVYSLAFGSTARRSTSGDSTMYPEIVSAPTYRGSRACKFPMPASASPTTNYRSELSLLAPVAEIGDPFVQGTEHFIGLAVYLNAAFPTGATSISTSLCQALAANDLAYYNSNPKIALRALTGGNWGFSTEFAGSGASHDSGVSIAADRATWTRLVAHIKWHSAGLGFLRLYRNGTQIYDSGNLTTWDGGSSVFPSYKIGNYSALRQWSADGDRTLTLDSFRFASSSTGGSLTSVDPASY